MDFSGLFGSRVRVAACRIEEILARWGVLILVVLAAIYYGSYYRTGLNLGGEGGLDAVQAMRLMEGQRPIVDTFLGYNLLWFYPLVALFKITGPDYIAMRIFFFVLSAVNAILGFLIVRRVTRQAWLALVVGVFLVLVPGMMFRNYMGLIGVLSMWALLKGYVLPAASRGRQVVWMGFVGVALSITYLLRIEPSLLLTVVWIGLAVLYPLGRREIFWERVRTSLVGTVLAIVLLVGIHGVFAWHAYQRGFGREFVGQYTGYVGLLRYELESELKKFSGGKPEAEVVEKVTLEESVKAPEAAIAPTEPELVKIVQEKEEGRDARLARPPLSKVWQAERPSNRFLGLGFYYPVFWVAIFVPLAGMILLWSVIRGDDANKVRALVILTVTGCSLVLFPQYFFFRPDAPHFSEFMVAFLPAVACAAFVVWEAAQGQSCKGLKWGAWVCVGFSVILAPIYMKAIMPREEAGTIVRHGKSVEFEGLNNVRVKVKESEAEALRALQETILRHSEAGDYVIVYPYSPTINFMTDRPSYEYDLYIDDTAAEGSFQKEAMERIDRLRPALLVIDNRPINRTERSRFKNWAKDLMGHIRMHYKLVGSHIVGKREIDVYARPDKVEAE